MKSIKLKLEQTFPYACELEVLTESGTQTCRQLVSRGHSASTGAPRPSRAPSQPISGPQCDNQHTAISTILKAHERHTGKRSLYQQQQKLIRTLREASDLYRECPGLTEAHRHKSRMNRKARQCCGCRNPAPPKLMDELSVSPIKTSMQCC